MENTDWFERSTFLKNKKKTLEHIPNAKDYIILNLLFKQLHLKNFIWIYIAINVKFLYNKIKALKEKKLYIVFIFESHK